MSGSFLAFLTETLSQIDMPLLAASLVVFFQQHFPQRDMYAMCLGF